MSKLFIGLLVFAAVFVPLLMVIMSKIEKIRLEKERKITQLTYNYLSLSAIAQGIPREYTVPALTVDVLREAVTVLEQLQKVKPKDRSVSKTLRLQKERLFELVEGAPTSTITHTPESIAEVKKIHHYQTKLANFLDIRQRKGIYTQVQVSGFIKQLQRLAIKCITDMYLAKTDEMVEQKKYHLAVFNLKKAITEFAKMPDNPDFQAAITQSKERLQELIKERENYRQQREQELTETRTRLQEKQQELWENALDGSETRKKYY